MVHLGLLGDDHIRDMIFQTIKGDSLLLNINPKKRMKLNPLTLARAECRGRNGARAQEKTK